MAFEGPGTDIHPGNAAGMWKRRLAKIQRRLRRAEDSLEHAASDFDQLLDELETGSAHIPLGAAKKTTRATQPLPVATAFAVLGPTSVTFVVHGEEFTAGLNRIQMVLLSMLKSPTREGVDNLVGFKTMGTLVHALRLHGWRATGRSVTVEISRLRSILGPTNRDLIESRRNTGYRFRLIRLAADTGRGTAA